jgi:hypothetical protein
VNKQLEKMVSMVSEIFPYSKAENETTTDAFDEFIANVCDDVYGQLFRIQSKSNVKTEK